MRIATLADASAEHTGRWVEWFRGRGHEVRVWSLEAPPPGLTVAPLPRAPLPGFLRYPLALPALRAELGRYAPDLVDAHFVPNYGLLGALSGLRPLAVTAWGSDLLISGSPDPLRRARARFVLRRADLVLADAENLAAAARALGAPPDRVRMVPWGADLERFAPGAEREPGLLLSARRHEPVYDLETVLRGVAPVLERHPHARLVVAGDGGLRPGLERRADGLLPPGRWRFTGRLTREELAALVARAEVYLSASLSDSTSVSLLEAMAAGAVPVVSDIAGNREWVAEGEGARLFPCGDAAALARAVEGVLGDPEWAAATRARNRRVVEERADRRRNLAGIEIRPLAASETFAGGRIAFTLSASGGERTRESIEIRSAGTDVAVADLPALLSRCALLAGVDSGPAHVAAVCGVPVVVLFSRTNDPAQWQPVGERVTVGDGVRLLVGVPVGVDVRVGVELAVGVGDDDLIAVHKEAANFKFENQKAAASPIPFHPGALKYFKEKGVWTPALEQAQQELLKMGP